MVRNDKPPPVALAPAVLDDIIGKLFISPTERDRIHRTNTPYTPRLKGETQNQNLGIRTKENAYGKYINIKKYLESNV